MIDEHSAMVTAVALSLYRYNVAPIVRAQKLYDHFVGNCMEMDELVHTLINMRGFEATELPFPTARVYIEQALERYGEEAQQRVMANLAEDLLYRP
ncbi:MAG: hypothetical protein GWN00_19985 [Aliifodinibius sp.]|nr:hypothetical protein [Fodinibius sp.]NIY27002.1 hypothetical protein [Fodinibius sp.]